VGNTRSRRDIHSSRDGSNSSVSIATAETPETSKAERKQQQGGQQYSRDNWNIRRCQQH